MKLYIRQKVFSWTDRFTVRDGDGRDRYTVEEVGLMAGFSSRQAFYLAFSRRYQVTPLAYRREAHAAQAAQAAGKAKGKSPRKAAPKAE